MVTYSRKSLRRTKSSPALFTADDSEHLTMSTSPHLERGKACLRCRGRKMRCDGARPTCGQCVRAEVGDCEYTDAGPTASQVLEQNVAQLEARIKELTEGRPVDSVVLQQLPGYAQRQQQQTGLPRLPSPTSPNFLRSFVTFSSGFGFFLQMSRFMEKMKLSVPHTDTSPLPSGLVYAVLLIDLMFSNDPSREATEQQLLSLVLQNVSAGLNPSRLIYSLQTEVLVSYYLFHKDRRVEGGYHAAAAVSIAVACNLHKIRSPRTPPGAANILPAPSDDVEEGERVNAFWTVFVLDRCWTVWMQSPSVLIDETSASTQVDTPWPLDMLSYEQHLMPQGNFGGQTVQAFLSGNAVDTEHQSLLSLRARASILYEKAEQIAARWSPHTSGFQSQFVSLDNRIDRFRASLPSLTQATSMRPDVVRHLITIHMLCYCATIHLHAPFSQNHQPSAHKIITAAQSAASTLQSIPVPQLVYVDPITGVLWEAVGRVLVNAFVNWQRNSISGQPLPPAAQAVKNSLDTVIAAMQALSNTCPLVANELAKLRSA